MNRKTLILVIIATTLLLVGGIMFGGIMMKLNFDFTKLSTREMVTNSYELHNDFENITIIADTADILLVPADKVSVECYEEENSKHIVSVKNGTLTIELVDHVKWYERIGINFAKPKIKLYLPQGQYASISIQGSTGDVKIPGEFTFETMQVKQSTGYITCHASVTGEMNLKASTGDIHVSDLSAGAATLTVTTGKISVSHVRCSGDMSLNVSTGDARLSDLSCNSLRTTGDTGKIVLENVITQEEIFIERSTGDVKLECCDAAELTIFTDTGSVTGTLLSDMVFLCKTDTGRVDVPKTTTGGKCEITTDTGDIKIKIVN